MQWLSSNWSISGSQRLRSTADANRGTGCPQPSLPKTHPKPSLHPHRIGELFSYGELLGSALDMNIRVDEVNPKVNQGRKLHFTLRQCSLSQAPRKSLTVRQDSGIAEFLTSTDSPENLVSALQLTIILQINCISKTNVLISPSVSR